jgi:hypothetical protein
MWRYSRVDYLGPHAECIFCNRLLRSRKGIVITNGVDEAFAGPNCAKKMLGPPEERLLDVTRLALLVVSDDDPTSPAVASTLAGLSSNPHLGSAPKTQDQARSPLPPLDKIVQYLRLRCEFMVDFAHHRSQILTQAFDAYSRTGQLDDADRKRVAGTIRNAGEQNTVFSEANVMRCIGINHWLREALENTQADRREFLTSMLNKLHSQWHLTEAQLAAVNRWGEWLRKKVHSFPHLDTQVFNGVVVPEFMKSKGQKKPKL